MFTCVGDKWTVCHYAIVSNFVVSQGSILKFWLKTKFLEENRCENMFCHLYAKWTMCTVDNMLIRLVHKWTIRQCDFMHFVKCATKRMKTMSATIISFVSSKGGPGKSTLTTHTAIILAEGGAKVAVMDADPSGRMTRISQNADNGLGKYFTVFPNVTAENLVQQVQIINNDFDFILIDPEGVLSDLIVQIAKIAHIVISPMKLGQGDIEESTKTAAVINQVAKDTGRDINLYFVLNDVSTTRSGLDAHWLEVLRKSNFKTFQTIIYTRVAYKETTDLGVSLLELSPKRVKAHSEITRLVEEVFAAIKSHYEEK
ncbi:MAG: hypothetical protein COA43_00550 [Robiginitomaculum sp.]|nr:MAG: hypothetical protein COA43_00550 [Robiginitomaculum sp.]